MTRAERPRFAAILDRLRGDIRQGRFRQNDMLPGERDLAAELAVSRTTLRRMLAILVEDGLLHHRQGVGTFVAPAPPSALPAAPLSVSAAPLRRLPGFTDELTLRGIAASSEVIANGLILPTPEDVMMLACSPQERVIRLSRLRCGDGRPLAVDRTVVPRRFLDPSGAIGPSLYATLDDNGFPPVRVLHRVQGALMGADEAAPLGAEPGTAAIQVRRVAYLADGRSCEFTRSTYQADDFDFIVELRGQTPS